MMKVRSLAIALLLTTINGGRAELAEPADNNCSACSAVSAVSAFDRREQESQPQPTVQDEYAIYDLLSPDSSSFRTVYEVTVTTPGATTFLDRIGSGLTFAQGADDAVVDVMTGAPLKFEQVTGGLQLHLARPVPPDGGQARLRITKAYKDAKSYRREGEVLVFDRAIGIRHAAIVLPAGYRLTACNVPSQVLVDPGGRIRVSFMHQA